MDLKRQVAPNPGSAPRPSGGEGMPKTGAIPRRSGGRRASQLASSLSLWAVAAILALPVVALILSLAGWDADATQVLSEMAQTVLPAYVLTSVSLCLAVGLAVAVLGLGAAATVTLFDFPGRRTAEWALLLPLAMPAYVVAYAYTDFFQFAGPAQTWLRDTFGLRGRVLPEVRSWGGAVWVFAFTLYPYVYLLARTALSERAATLMEAARLLGAPLSRRLREIALPLARPAVAAGVALALMETLADYGVSSYFGIQTFTAGIYKAWLVMDNRVAAAQLALLLLATVAVLLALERRAQRRRRFAMARGADRQGSESRRVRLEARGRVVAWLICGVPVLAGFLVPTFFMLRPLWAGWADVNLGTFGLWAWHSLRLGAVSAGLAVMVAVGLAFAQRRRGDAATRTAVQIVGLGYAVPGAVVVVGLLLPWMALQAWQPQWGVGGWLTATSLGLVWAYLVRFTAVALQSVQSGYARLPASMDDSARTLGVVGWRLLARVHGPLLRRPVVAAALLVFVDVMKELPATLVLRPFDSDTLAVMAYQLARDERLGEAALPALTLVAVGLLPVILLSRTLRRDTT
jgi:iron(III) transport system permease protein